MLTRALFAAPHAGRRLLPPRNPRRLPARRLAWRQVWPHLDHRCGLHMVRRRGCPAVRGHERQLDVLR